MSEVAELEMGVAGASGESVPHLIIRLSAQYLAISAQHVNQLILMPEVTKVPQAPEEVRGMINVRGGVMPLVDLRALLGMPSFIRETADLIQALEDRERDHNDWLTELAASVREKRAFRLARNPHLCKFGKWYDVYKPQNQSVAFLAIWHSFDRPHCRIHGIADHVCDLAAKGDHASALAIIEAARDGELRELVANFDLARSMLRETTREVAMVLRRGKRQLAVSVDEVVAIEPLEQAGVAQGSELNVTLHGSLTPGVAKRKGSGQIALLLDAERLYEYAHSCDSERL